MKVYSKTAFQLKVKDPLAGGPGRISKLAEIEANAIEFAGVVLAELDIPTMPELSLGNMHGFEDVNVDFSEAVGVVHILASFKTLSGNKIRMDMPIPIYKGKFQKPSVVKLDGKVHVFSKALVDDLIKRNEHSRPKWKDQPNYSRSMIHETNIERGMYKAPLTDANYFDLLLERY